MSDYDAVVVGSGASPSWWRSGTCAIGVTMPVLSAAAPASTPGRRGGSCRKTSAVWGRPPPRYLSGGQHQAGTCRMGEDPAISVVDPFCSVHSQDNLFVADSSPHVTNGGFNPVETIMALSWRIAENIVYNW